MNSLERALSQTLNFQYIHERLLSSGQPTVEQLKLIKAYGINTVINLALSDTNNAVEHEDKICLELGLNYIQLPIDWELPDPEQALFVIDTLNFLLKQQNIWIHCSENYCASALIYLYRQYYMNTDIEQAQHYLHQIWEPNDTWTGLIHNVALQLHGRKATLELQQALMGTKAFS
ncbi:protein tyrosine phosphatase family protein [Acinetobacter sp. ANC 5383]